MIHKKYVITLLLLPTLLFAQFEINKHILGPSIGFSFLGSAPQLGINHEYSLGLDEFGLEAEGKLGLGGIIRYWSYSENFVNVEWDYTDILIGIQSNYHFYMSNDNIDPWLGVILAYDFGSSDFKIKTAGFNIIDDSHGGFWLGANGGIRYWFKENMSINLRIGFGTLSYGALDLGFDYKIK